MISTSDGSQAKAKAFLKDKSQKIMEYMPELQKARMPDALARTEKVAKIRVLELRYRKVL